MAGNRTLRLPVGNGAEFSRSRRRMLIGKAFRDPLGNRGRFRIRRNRLFQGTRFGRENRFSRTRLRDWRHARGFERSRSSFEGPVRRGFRHSEFPSFAYPGRPKGGPFGIFEGSREKRRALHDELESPFRVERVEVWKIPGRAMKFPHPVFRETENVRRVHSRVARNRVGRMRMGNRRVLNKRKEPRYGGEVPGRAVRPPISSF